MRKKITLKEIAKELDVSISTVSKALKNSSEISYDTRQKIQAFAKLYNYKPNNIAISLKNRRTKNIGVIIPEIVHYFFTMVISGIEKVANSKGYNVIVCLSDESFDKEVINMEMLANGSIDGFIISLAKETQLKQDFNHLREIMRQGMQLVMFDRVADEIYCDKVVVDDSQGAYMAANYLIAKGHQKIALISTLDHVSVGRLRTIGYKNALKDAGMPVNEDLILKIEGIEGYTEIERLFNTQQFDAVLAVNEVFAVTAMKIAQKRGISIPENMSFIGFTDGILSRYTTPTLTTVAQHGFKMGETAARMLIAKLEETESDESVKTEVIKTSLIERESTRK